MKFLEAYERYGQLEMHREDHFSGLYILAESARFIHNDNVHMYLKGDKGGGKNTSRVLQNDHAKH